jgi:DNA-binding NtrC family response regulator
MQKLTVMLCSTDTRLESSLSCSLDRCRFDFINTPTESEVKQYYGSGKKALLILDISTLDTATPLALIRSVKYFDRRTPIICILCQESLEYVLEALRIGVKNCLFKPITTQDIINSVEQLVVCDQWRYQTPSPMTPPTIPLHDEGGMIGVSQAFHLLKEKLSKFSHSDCNVLITGETGTGKELAARFIHSHSSRCERPLIAVNCAAIPEALFESELFGYERGAFTGAHASYQGRMRLANGGVLFLDEIGELSPLLQAKLLRVLETKEVFPLGAKRHIPVDIRVISATNCDLERLVLEKKFRKDLYFRINIGRIHIPPLQERKEDIPFLVRHYISSFHKSTDSAQLEVADDVIKLLMSHTWPGNIRELKNVIEAMLVDVPNGILTTRELPLYIHMQLNNNQHEMSTELYNILEALNNFNWNKSKAANALNWSRMTLYRKMEKYKILHDKTE